MFPKFGYGAKSLSPIMTHPQIIIWYTQGHTCYAMVRTETQPHSDQLSQAGRMTATHARTHIYTRAHKHTTGWFGLAQTRDLDGVNVALSSAFAFTEL